MIRIKGRQATLYTDNLMAHSPLLIALMGKTGSGKSSFINAVAGQDIAVVGRGLTSETSKIEAHEITYRGRPVILVDTPGFSDLRFGDTTKQLSNADVLCQIAEFLSKSPQTAHKFSALIYTYDINETRMGLSSVHDIALFRKICAEHASGNVTVATTFWDCLETNGMGEQREAELQSRNAFFAELTRAGAKFRRCGTTESGKPLTGPKMSTPCSIIDGILGVEPTELDLRQEIANLRELVEKDSGSTLRFHVSEVADELITRIDALERKVALLQISEIDRLSKEVDNLRGQVERLQGHQNGLQRVKSVPLLRARHFGDRVFRRT